MKYTYTTYTHRIHSTQYTHRARTLNNKEMNLIWIRKYTLDLIPFVMTGTREPIYRGNSDNSTKIDWPRNKAQFHRFRCFSGKGGKRKRKRKKERKKERTLRETTRSTILSSAINSILCARQKLSYRFDWLPRNQAADEAGNRWKRRKTATRSVGSFISLRFMIAKMERDRSSFHHGEEVEKRKKKKKHWEKTIHCSPIYIYTYMYI